MKIKQELQEEKKEFSHILEMFRKRKFEGNTGQAIKNSSYQLATTLVAKFGSLIFTIIMARMLMPELFGFYTLTLSTIVLLSSFSDFGLGAALMTFVSKSLGNKNKEKAKAYFEYIGKYKIYSVLAASLILLVSSYFIANYYYNKPIFFALLTGVIYLPLVNLVAYFETGFRANNNFKYPFFKEIILQFLRISIIPLGILFLINKSLSNEIIISSLILFLSFSYFICFLFLLISSRANLDYLNSKKEILNSNEKRNFRQFMIPLAATALSGTFFGYIDTIMLGHFVSGEFIGYYGSAFSLVASASVLLGFVGIGVFPIFSRLKGKALNLGFKKTLVVTLFISILAAIFTFFLASIIIQLIYGSAYLSAGILLKLFSLLIVVLPLASIYDFYFISQEKTKRIAKLLIGATILNIILNYLFITFGLKYGMLPAVIGAGLATIISRSVYLFSLIIYKRKN